ncbi:FGGY family carbohydrate kinase [Oricola sp.]|uniref:FGGY family carbohydrate kinase n=1 Tax=Oricola sp. TaxID=1979950 RepID=UPI003BAC7011
MRVGAIDQGTTSTRSFVIEADGTRRVTKAIEHRQNYPQSGWVEHDPEELVANIKACIDAAGPLDALGIDNQGESCLAWDAATGQALSPVIVWQDERTAETIARLKADGAEDLTLARAGLPLDAYFSAAKLGWIVANLPEAKDALARGSLRLGTTDAFFADRLAGRFVTDVSTASRTSLMNIATCRWDPDLCALFGVPAECLPEIVSNTGEFGTVSTAAGPVPLTALIVDQQAALYGAGCRAPGEAKVTFGTGAFALMVTGGEIHHEQKHGLLPTVAWRKHGEQTAYALDGGVFTAAAALNWARGLGLFETFDAIAGFDKPPVIDRGVVFVPALSGLGCPHWDRQARGTWLGLGLEDGPADMVQAVLEGVALRAAEVLYAMESAVAMQGAVPIDGGLTRNPYFTGFFADAIDRAVERQDEPEVTAFGTALLAGEAIGAPAPPPASRQRTEPRGDGVKRREAFSRAVALSRQWHC